MDVKNYAVNIDGTVFFESNCYELEGSQSPACFVPFAPNIHTKHWKEQEQEG